MAGIPRRHNTLAIAAMLFMVGSAVGFIWNRSTFVDPRPTTILSDRQGEFLGQIDGTVAGYGYWPVAPIPLRVSAAVLALEDHRFWDHPGVDPVAVLHALRSNVTQAHRVSGASTLAMQVARMQHPVARGYIAKIVEMATAVTMTERYGRDGVLEQYLRLVPFGQNSHGIAHAARWYFDKPVEDLSWAEIALLSAIPQAPGAMNPETETGRLRAVARGHRALARLHTQGVLTDDEFIRATGDIDHLVVHQHPTRPPDALQAVLRIQDLMTAQSPLERARSTIDLRTQLTTTRLARQRLDALRARGAVQMAVLVLDPSTAEVRALVGSSRYVGADAGMINYASRPRSPGSTLKPFIYAQALQRGDITPTTILVDSADSGTGIENADRRFLGPLLPRQALGNSRNVPAAKLVRLSGLLQTYWFLGSLGLHGNVLPAEQYGLTVAVGGLPTSLDRLVAAYDAIANDGVLRPLKWFEGQDLPPSRRVMRTQIARELTIFLADPMARLPSFGRMSATDYPFPVAVKTGTSQGYRDAWVVAYSARYLVGVWMGRPDGRPMNGLSGATSAAAVAHDILMALQGQESDGQDDGEFRRPPGLSSQSLCAQTGRLDDGHCNVVLTEFVPPGVSTVLTPLPAAAGGATPIRLRIASPGNHVTFFHNPELPPSLAFVPMRLRDGAGIAQVVWFVDGKRFRLAGADQTVRWPIAAGRHRIEAKSPFGQQTSPEVEINVE